MSRSHPQRDSFVGSVGVGWAPQGWFARRNPSAARRPERRKVLPGFWSGGTWRPEWMRKPTVAPAVAPTAWGEAPAVGEVPIHVAMQVPAESHGHRFGGGVSLRESSHGISEPPRGPDESTMTQDGDDDNLDAQVERLSRLSVVEAGE